MNPKILLYEPRIDYQNTYCLNLLVYTNAQLEIIQKIDKLYQRLWEQDFEAVFVHISKDEKKVEDILFNIYAPIKKKDKKPIIIVQGVAISPYEEILAFENNIPVKELVSTFAKKIGITAKYMASLNVGEFYPIPTRYLLPGWQVVKSVYYKDNTDNYIPLLSDSEFFTAEILEKLNGDSAIFVKSEFRLELINSFTSNLLDKLNKDLSIEERASLTDTAFQMVAATMQSIDLPETSLQLAKSAIGSMEKIVRSTKSLNDIFEVVLADKNSLRFKHSLLSLYIGYHLIPTIPWASKTHEESWAHLCFFHDIMLPKDEWILYDHESELDKKISPKDRELILNHARLAAKVLSQSKDLPLGLDTLLKQHHGSKMGDGLGKLSMSISPLSILFVVVENYVHFFLTEPEKAKRPDQVNEFLDKLFKKYPFPNYKKTIVYLKNIPLKAS